MAEIPKILYEAEDYRVVLRSTRDYPEGYVEIEQQHKDATGVTAWHHVDSLSLNYLKQTGHVAVRLFLHLMRDKCANGELRPASNERV